MMSPTFNVLLYTVLLEDMNPAQITPLITSRTSQPAGWMCSGITPLGARSSLAIDTPRPFTAGNCVVKAGVTAAPMLLLTFPAFSNPVKKKLSEFTDEGALQG
ncbi:hypothetical protein A7L55_18025 [Acinetobacter baumannii]|nr:hypothetical protein A7L55_18025 [Acinetobacter baumannii]